MKWHWFALLAGLGLYILVSIPGFLPHTLDSVAVIFAGATIASVAIFGFDSTHVDRKLAILLVAVSLIMLGAGVALAEQGHNFLLFLLSVPALGLGIFGARKLMDKREKHD